MMSRLPRYEAVCATQVLPMRVGTFAFRYQGNGATPCRYIDTTRKAIDCATTLPLTLYIMLIFALDELNIRHISTSDLVDLLTWKVCHVMRTSR